MTLRRTFKEWLAKITTALCVIRDRKFSYKCKNIRRMVSPVTNVKANLQRKSELIMN